MKRPIQSIGIHHALSALFFILIGFCSPAFSQPITANVIGAKVGGKGVIGGEYRSGYEWDESNPAVDGLFTDRIDLFGNVSDGVQARVFLNRITPEEGDSEFTSLFIEPAFQLSTQADLGVDMALLTGLILGFGEGRANGARAILTVQRQIGQFRLRHNSIVGRQFGEDASENTLYQPRFRLTHSVYEKIHGGLEFFGQISDIGDPGALSDEPMRGGLVFEGPITEHYGFQMGLLNGLTDSAPDWALKLWLSARY